MIEALSWYHNIHQNDTNHNDSEENDTEDNYI
jgi:hypothetical protein